MSAKQQLVRYYKLLRSYGYNDSHSGNASVRDDDTVWITPTGACADDLVEDSLIACKLEGKCKNGASLDAPLHVAVYNKNQKTIAVLHSHSAYTVAMTLNGKDFSPIDFEGQLYFPSVPVITIPYDQYLERSPSAVSDVLKTNRITVVRGHGVYACGESLELAYKWTCSLELSAKTAFLARQLGTS